MADIQRPCSHEGKIGYLFTVIESDCALVQSRKAATIEGSLIRLSAMRASKRALDPHGILNPGAVIGPEDGAPG